MTTMAGSDMLKSAFCVSGEEDWLQQKWMACDYDGSTGRLVSDFFVRKSQFKQIIKQLPTKILMVKLMRQLVGW